MRFPDGFEEDVRRGMSQRKLAQKYMRPRRTIRRWIKGLEERANIPQADEKPGISFVENGNYAVASSTDGRIRTLEDLLAVCKVDLSVWKVRDKDGWEVKAWEGYAANEQKDLKFERGQITGEVKRDGIITETLYSVRATFVRREPIPIKPVIQPITCPQFNLSKVNPRKSEGVAMVIADPHFGFEWQPPSWKLVPFHDRRVLDIFLQILEQVQPDVIEFDGDFLDLTMWQDKFTKDAAFFQTTQPALLECHFFLRHAVEIAPKAKKRLHQGNHEARMEKALTNHLQEACELRAVDELELPPALSVPKLLALHKLGVDWIGGYSDDIAWLGENIKVIHGSTMRGKPMGTVTEALKQGRYHVVVGHIHRDEMVSESRITPGGPNRQITGYCPGCACHVDGRVPGSNSNSNWRQGIGIIEWSGRYISITHIPVHNGVAVWNGQRFEARDWVGPLREAYPDWNW